jgi:N-acylglucosamine-6-phosphate 2-epimerase
MILDRLRGGLIVSIQPESDSPLNTAETVALLARCAVAAGAAGLRIQGVAHIAAVRAAVDVPVIGLIKRDYPGFSPYITTTAAEVGAIVDAGAEIVAFDATPRARAGGLDAPGLIAAVHARGAIAMADCATGADARAAAAAGAEIVGTTLCGYTDDTRGHDLPALDVLRDAAASGAFAILEGGVGDPAAVASGFEHGAGAVVVGTALTNIDARMRLFAGASPRQKSATDNRSQTKV